MYTDGCGGEHAYAPASRTPPIDNTQSEYRRLRVTIAGDACHSFPPVSDHPIWPGGRRAPHARDSIAGCSGRRFAEADVDLNECVTTGCANDRPCAVGRGRFLVLPIVDGSTRRAPPCSSPVAAYLADSLKSVPETYAMDLSSLAFGIHLVRKSDGFSASGTCMTAISPAEMRAFSIS